MERPAVKNYKQTILVDTNKEKAFDAITKELDKWWGKIDRNGDGQGIEFSIFFGSAFWKFRVQEFVPSERITWLCIEAAKGLQKEYGIDHEEWIGSRVHWQISSKQGRVAIDMVHQGLTRQLPCYNTCSTAWDFYLLESLKQYLKNGIGQPGQD